MARRLRGDWIAHELLLPGHRCRRSRLDLDRALLAGGATADELGDRRGARSARPLVTSSRPPVPGTAFYLDRPLFRQARAERALAALHPSPSDRRRSA